MLVSENVRTVVGLFVAFTMQSYAHAAPAQEANLRRSWNMGALGLQATEWRVTDHGIERGAMATLEFGGVATTKWTSVNARQVLSLGGGEGGFQSEYVNRFAAGVRFLRFGQGAVVLRGGLDLELIITPHGSAGQLGPLFDLGYQTVTQSGFLDAGLQTVVTVLPAAFTHDSSHHAAEWFKSGPHLSAGARSLFFDGTVSRSMQRGELFTEFFT